MNEQSNFLPQYTIEEFRALSKPEQRRAIARDAVAQINLNRYSAYPGMYFQTPVNSVDPGQELRNFLITKDVEPCSVCALGAVFSSAVRLDDEFTLSNGDVSEHCRSAYLSFSDIEGKLGEFFDEKQMDLMEVAFETPSDCSDLLSKDQDDLNYRAQQFGYNVHPGRHNGATTRLLAILNNIADDEEGLFRP